MTVVRKSSVTRSMLVAVATVAVAATAGCGEERSSAARAGASASAPATASPSRSSGAAPDLVRLRFENSEDAGNEVFGIIADGDRRFA
jgi:hypothetical protein